MNKQIVYKVVRKVDGKLYSFGYKYNLIPDELVVQYIPGKFVRSNGLMPLLFAFNDRPSAFDFLLKTSRTNHEVWECEAVISDKKPQVLRFLDIRGYYYKKKIAPYHRAIVPDNTVMCSMIKLVKKIS